MNLDLPKLTETANLIRQDIVKMLLSAGSGHSAGSLGIVEVLTSLYFGLLHHDPQNPKIDDRNRLVLSCGHVCPALYATLARAGYFPLEKLESLRQIDSQLQGHPHIGDLPGIENSSGPLGQGLSMAVGLALAAKRDKKNWKTVCITSDGEQQEGQVWEAYMFASKYKLDNLLFILDRNQIQIGGYTREVMPLEPLRAKYQAFGLFVLEVDGHDFEQIYDSFYKAQAIKNQPTIIIAHTIPGKDVEFMENLPDWHGKTPDLGEGIEALAKLRSLNGKINYD
jgi:transketolase